MDEFGEGLSLEDWIDTLASNSPEKSAFERLARDLWKAVEDDNVQNLRSLLEQRADPNHEVFWSEEWEDDYPPLHTACLNGNFEIVKELVNAGANVDANDRADGSTPLHLACINGCEEVVDYLIREARCTVDVSDDDGRSPLDIVLEDVDDEHYLEYRLDLGLYLINHGCCGDEGKVKLLCVACLQGRLDIVEELVELHKVDPNDVKGKDNRSPLHLACERRNKGLVEYLVEEANCDVNVRDDHGRSPLDRVLEVVDDEDVLRYRLNLCLYLINHGCGGDEGKVKLMFEACFWRNLDVVKKLVELHKVDPNDVRNYEGQSPLDTALEDMYEVGYFDLVVYLISHGCGDEEDRAIVLAQACRQGRLDVVKELVEQHKVDPKYVGDDEGQSPLDIALEDMYKNSRFHVAVYLISHDCGDDEERANVLANCEINVRDENYRSPLHLACVRGYKDMVEYLVEKANCDLNVRYEGNKSPLHWACEGGHKDMVEYLVEKANCDVNVRDEGDRSPLHLACEEGHKDVVEYLVEKANCDINVRDGSNWSPLHFACEGRNKDVVEYLVEKANCDVNTRDKSNQTPLHKSCGSWQCSLDVVQYLVETTNCDVNVRDEYGRSPLHLACEGGHKDVVKYLVEKANCDVNVRDEGHRSPLHLACLGGHKDVAQYLVEKANCDVNMRDKNNQTPLHKSCGSSQCPLDMVQYLVENANCNVNMRDDKGRTPLDTAIENNTIAVRYLMDHGSGMCGDKQRGKLLCRACISDNLDMVKKLVEQHKVDPKVVRDEDNRSPLHLACEEGHKYVVEYLVEKASCDVNMRDDDDMSPLDVACVRGRKYVVEYLVKKADCDVNMRDKNSQTPLHKCCGSWRDILVVVEYMVENTNCDVNVRDDQGRTPLDTAIENNTSAALYLINRVPGMCGDKERGKLLCRACNSGELDIVKELIIKHKVDPEGVRDEGGRSPLHWACEGGHKRVVEYLVEKANCDVNVKDKESRSPLHLACEGGQKDVVEYLVEKANCDVNVRDQYDSSPLHLACEGGHKGVVKYLVEKARCDVNVRDKNNQTPLHKSCGSWCFTLDMVQCLIENTNCDINVSDDKDKTPLDLATERSIDTALSKHVRKKWTKVVDYLKSVPGAQSAGGGQKRVNTENHESSPPPSKRPRTQSDVTDCRDMTSLDLAIDTRLDQDQRAVPTEHSAGQKRVSSENLESRPPPSKQPRIQNDSTIPPRRTCPECNQPCDIHCKKCPNPQCGQKLPPIRSCRECNRSCHVRCKKCPHPECGYTFPPTSKSKATGEAKKNPASLLQILQKKVEQLGQNGYNVAVMVHKPNPERDTFNKYSTDGAARDYIDSPDVFNNWKEHFKKSSRDAGTFSGRADTAGTSSGGSDTAGTSSGADTAGTSSGGADTAGTSGGGAASLSSDQMSAIVQEVLKQMQKKT